MKTDAKQLLETNVTKEVVIQGVWGGYGAIVRKWLASEAYPTVVCKCISLPQPHSHPKGWNTSLSHQRKLRSFDVEVSWYRDYSSEYDPKCLSPLGLVCESNADGITLIMSDLASIGLSVVEADAAQSHWRLCLTWLANFHAKYMHSEGRNLWPEGTYWHLATRPDEHDAMAPGRLKLHASLIAQTLSDTHYQTLVHGDAKLANFCFSPALDRVGAVDFQYVGRGCGIKDVMLFISSCVPLDSASSLETELLDHYFTELGHALAFYQPQVDASKVEHEWRPLYCVAWADFVRFLQGWSPEHWKLCGYSNYLAEQALEWLATD